MEDTSFVPQSLSLATKPSVRRPSHIHQASLAATSKEKRGVSSKQQEAAILAREEAAAISASLGLRQPQATPFESSAGIPEGNPRPHPSSESAQLVKLRTLLGDKDNEITGLRRQITALRRENDDLKTTSTVGGLRARELEEVEREFASQESLLQGYQKEAERSVVTIEQLKDRQRKLGQFLEKLYGPAWEGELSRHLTTPSAPLVNSPRTRGRPSLLTMPSGSGIGRVTIASTPEGDESSDTLETLSAALVQRSVTDNGNGTSADELKSHLESVQKLLRGMERRLISRDVELEELERRAREEKTKAEQRTAELRQLVEDSVAS